MQWRITATVTPSSRASCAIVFRLRCHSITRAICSSVRTRGRPTVLFMTESVADAGGSPARGLVDAAPEQSRSEAGPRDARALRAMSLIARTAWHAHSDGRDVCFFALKNGLHDRDHMVARTSCLITSLAFVN
jgi:hypothetical protein